MKASHGIDLHHWKIHTCPDVLDHYSLIIECMWLYMKLRWVELYIRYVTHTQILKDSDNVNEMASIYVFKSKIFVTMKYMFPFQDHPNSFYFNRWGTNRPSKQILRLNQVSYYTLHFGCGDRERRDGHSSSGLYSRYSGDREPGKKSWWDTPL